MDDRAIIALFNARSETAIAYTVEKYGDYCRAIAFRILQNDEDADECVNDTYWQAWTTIPPQSPRCLRVFPGTITRHLSINLFHKRHADKSGGGQVPLSLGIRRMRYA